MDVRKLERDSQKVKAVLKELSNGSVVTTEPCKIHVPVRFTIMQLAEIGQDVFTTGIIPIIIQDRFYSVLNINAVVHLTPLGMTKKSINDVEYYELFFDKGSTVFKTLNLVRRDTLVYYIYDELIQKGNIPWYFGYDDIGRLFDTAKEYANVNIGARGEVGELIMSLIGRDPKDLTKYYRTSVKSFIDVDKIRPEFIPLKNVIFNATNTLNKLAGSYMNDGIISALVTTTEKTDRIEQLLRQ